MTRSPKSQRKRWSPGMAVVAAAVVAAAAILVALPQEAAAAPTRVLTITGSSAGPAVAFKGFDGNPPKLYDFNGDGRKEIVAQNDNQYVYVFDSKSGKLLAEMKTKFPSGWGARSFNGPEASVLEGGGAPRLIVANSAATITSYRFDGVLDGKMKFTKEWERRLTDCHGNPAMDSKPVLADLDKDGRMEILAQTEESGVYALRSTGSVYWKHCIGGGNAEPTVGDLNRDGFLDVVWVSDGGYVNAHKGNGGGWLWSFNTLARFDLHSASMPVGAAVGQLDGVGGPDVVVGARDSHDPDDWSKDHAMLLALDSGGKLLWAKQDPTGNPLTYTHAIIADADGTGGPEVYWGDWNTIGHKPPYDEADSWKVTGPAHFYRYDAQGNMVWRQTLGTYWSNKDVPIADIDGDGAQEMMANGPNAGHDGIWLLNVKTGAKESFIDLHPYKMQRAPVVADLWGTGTMQFVVEVAPAATGATGAAIMVYDTGKPYSAAWPSVPQPKGAPTGGTSPPPPPPPTTGTFDATFDPRGEGNAWWVEAAVTANQPLAKVEAKVDSGAYTALPRTSWGTYAKSIHVPVGSTVTFRATSTSGATDTHGPVDWHGTGGTGGTGGTFQATFTPKAVGNDWWVETAVSANQPIAKVEAKVGAGAWTQLPKTDWGTYAKSVHAPNGSQVTFRATSTGGSTVTSSAYTWP